MVSSVARKKHEIEEQQKLSATIKLSEVVDEGLRFEAAAYNIEVRAAVAAMVATGLPLQPLFGPSGLCKEAHNAFRFVRHWVDSEYGVPFLSSSDIISMRPEVDAYISRNKTKRLNELIIKPWDVLICCSGTIGNIG